ncbi:ferritin-like domain-containing protein [Williamsia sp.]|uniref:ferritin-like domain-containing protein n=1 Tax=Williamsia sp. TaxID=1872085 RepID=UPI001A3098C5|nr:ferritin-like domain-containing protein [Williamsia sp.]MBJ7289332.1 ferritin-like domain-containing protein [Williamsia sp.]
MTLSTSGLRQQLRTVLTLTNTEIQVAETRIAQARTEAVREELTKNAENGRVRAVAISEALRGLGGLPALVSPLVGRTAALGKTFFEQAQPLDEALLGDLALEHQLLDRSRYIKALATAANESEVVALADRLITAHSATVEWLTVVLAEEALGGPVALRRTPVQWVSGVAARAATIPGAFVARGADRAIDTARQVPTRISGLRKQVEEVGETATKTIVASRDAALEAAEGAARDSGAPGLADSLHNVREATGTVAAEDLPISGYEELNVSSAVSAVKELDQPADIRLVISFEEAHKNRSGIISAAQTQLAAIAKDIVGVN